MELLLNVLKYMFGSWQLGIAALFFLLLFPLVFILASLKPKIIRKKPAYTKKTAKTVRKTVQRPARSSMRIFPSRKPAQRRASGPDKTEPGEDISDEDEAADSDQEEYGGDMDQDEEFI